MYFCAQPTPSRGPKPNFTRFDIELKRPKDITIIKVDNTDLGLYVDEKDGWKVKATSDQKKWNAFRIGDFHPQYPPKQPSSENGTWRSFFCAYIGPSVLNLLSDYDVIGIGSLRHFCVPCTVRSDSFG